MSQKETTENGAVYIQTQVARTKAVETSMVFAITFSFSSSIYYSFINFFLLLFIILYYNN